MAFTARVPGNTVRAADITELQDALSGTSGAGQPIAMTALSDSSNYALDVRNLDTTNSYGLRVRDSGSLNLLLAQLAGCTLGKTTTLNGWGATAITTDLKLVNASITWSGSGVTFTALKLNVTNTASAADSLLMDLQVGGTPKFSVRKDGGVLAATIGPSLTQQHTLPAVTSDTFVTLAATQTLTAKTLTSPTINSASLSTPNVTNILYVNESANANMTTGITINQGSATNEIVALKNSGFTPHSFTSITEADTFGEMHISSATLGGVALIGYASSGAAAAPLVLAGRRATDVTTHDATGGGFIHLTAQLLSGTTTGSCGANSNLVIIRNHTATTHIFDADGDIFCDAGGSYGGSVISGATVLGYNTYDEFEDAELVRTLEVERNGRGLVRGEFDSFLRYNREDLQNLKLANFGEDGSVFVNYTGLARLHSGAIWQMYRKLTAALEKLASIEQRLVLESGNG